MTRIAIALALTFASMGSAELPLGWEAVTGDGWEAEINLRPALWQRSVAGHASALHRNTLGGQGAWRCFVQPSLGAEACGLWFLMDRTPKLGFRCELGGNPDVGGFALKGESGEMLWEDKWAPWTPYEAYILEGVVETGRVRAQLFHYDGTLISQSDWVEVPLTTTTREGGIGVYTQNGIARFWGAELSDTPLCPITDDAPNKRRLFQGEDSEWVVHGTGNWMWTDAKKVRVRQYAQAERAWAVNRAIRGTDRVWRTAVRTDEGTGGAGMIFKADENAKGGFNCWLGGTHGAGGLMLYQNAGPGGRGKALWSSAQDKWHWDEDLVLQAETNGDQVRVQLFAGDGEALIVESPWIAVTPEGAAREGLMGFHTWKGSVEFWGFSEDTGVGPATAVATKQSALGEGWVELGGTWGPSPERAATVRQTSDAEQAACIETRIEGARGTWRCHVTVPQGEGAAGLLLQASADLKEGFLALLAPGKVQLIDLAQPNAPRWEREHDRQPGRAYVLEGLVRTDRIVLRLLEADGETLIAESPAVYVSDRNNDRLGHIGFLTRGGPAEFAKWSFTPED